MTEKIGRKFVRFCKVATGDKQYSVGFHSTLREKRIPTLKVSNN